MQLSEWKHWFSIHREEILRDFFTFLRFKTIATDSQFDKDTKACAKWLVQYLRTIGLTVEEWETSCQPVVFAKTAEEKKGCPTLLIYQHYDVQPVDPLELWKSAPFEPVIRNGCVYARGAQDNKGQCFYTITAIRALLELSKTLHFNLKVFIEGEEESGSRGTLEVFAKKKKDLQSEYLLVVDSGIPSPNVPAITLGIRGILTTTLEVRTANIDMHSGSMGGIAYNPIHALIQALAKCWDEKGKVSIPHFYDDVAELTSEEKKLFDFSLDEAFLTQAFGLRAVCPEPGYTLAESVSIRPTFEINGISGGYVGEGFKTVIPARAMVKISFRLVPNQDPEKVYSSFQKYIKAHLPEGIAAHVQKGQGFSAFRSNPNSLIAKRTIKAYEEILEKKPCKLILGGGSIPITVELAKTSGAEVVIMGYGLDTDAIHAPNEHFGLDRFEQGFLTMGSIFRQFNVQNS